MATSYNNSKCKQVEIYYYDYLCNENIEQIPGNIIEHIDKCPNCQDKIKRLKAGLSSQKSAKPGNRQVAVAVTDLLNLHLAFIGDKVALVPVGTFAYSPYTTTFTCHPNPDTDYSKLNFKCGVGINYHINANKLLVASIEMFGLYQDKVKEKRSGEDDYETTITTMTFPAMALGLESRIDSWLTGRFGAAQVYQLLKDKSDPSGTEPTEVTTRSSEFKATFGLAVEMGNFSLDIAFNEGLLFDGPNFISGTEDNLADRISLTYKF